MPLFGSFPQNMQNTAAVAKFRIRGDAEVACDRISRDKPNTINISCQLIRVMSDGFNRSITVLARCRLPNIDFRIYQLFSKFAQTRR